MTSTVALHLSPELKPFRNGLLAQVSCGFQCGTERWTVKTLSDPDAPKVTFSPQDATIGSLVSQTRPASLPENARVSPIETQTFRVPGRLVGFKLEDDQDIHIVIADLEDPAKTMIVEIPSPGCSGACASGHAQDFQVARMTLNGSFGQPTGTFKQPPQAVNVVVTGVGFFDFLHGQTGVAPNAIELHPVLALAIPSPPAINRGGTANGASFVAGEVVPGSIVSVFGTSLALVQASAGTLPLPATIGGSSVQLGGKAVPLFYVSPTQVNIQVPWELASQTATALTSLVGAVRGSSQTVNFATFGPGIFTIDSTGKGQGAILIAGTEALAAPVGSIPGRVTRPTTQDEWISIFCTGLGPVTNSPATGAAALSNPLSTTIATPTVYIGGVPAIVSFSGLAPGFVGLYQVNAQIPAGVPAADAVSLVLSIGGVMSNSANIAIQ